MSNQTRAAAMQPGAQSTQAPPATARESAGQGPDASPGATQVPDAQLTHVGYSVRDMDHMIAFYQRVLGLRLNDRGPYARGGEIAFLSRSREEHHQVVFASGRSADGGKSIINQISFRVPDLKALQRFHEILVAERVANLEPRNHGNAWSIYFSDPEGNRIELYAPSPWHVPQPFGFALDLTASEEDILRRTEALITDHPNRTTRQAWADSLDL